MFGFYLRNGARFDDWNELQYKRAGVDTTGGLVEYELPAEFQKSYYKKAFVVVDYRGVKYLRSYDTVVCKIYRGRFTRLWGGYSVTTMNHINDFINQNNYKGFSKSEWDYLPINKSVKLEKNQYYVNRNKAV